MRTHQESAEVSTDQSDEDWSVDRKEPQTSRWKLLMMKKGGGGNGAASSHTLTQLLAVRGTAWGTGEDKSLNLAQSRDHPKKGMIEKHRVKKLKPGFQCRPNPRTIQVCHVTSQETCPRAARFWGSSWGTFSHRCAEQGRAAESSRQHPENASPHSGDGGALNNLKADLHFNETTRSMFKTLQAILAWFLFYGKFRTQK